MTTKPYELVLRPSRGWPRIDLDGLWSYRDLLVLLVRRDFVAKYKQTVLGPAWFVLQPVLMTVVLSVVFGRVIGLSTDGLPPMLFYLCGQVGWSYFSQTFSLIGGSLAGNAALFGKVYFPRLIVPLSLVVSNAFAMAIQLATFAAFFVFFKYGMHTAGLEIAPRMLLLPVVVFQTAALAFAVGLIVAASTAKYRDLTHAIGVVTQVWMYTTPVIYPLSQFPLKWRWIAALNPMTPVMESYRWILLGVGMVEPAHELWSVAVTALMFVGGLLLFAKIEATFVDTI